MLGTIGTAQSAIIIGSFGKHLPQIIHAAQTFQKHGITTISPPGLNRGITGLMKSGSDDFLVLDADDPVDPKTLQDRVIEKMRRASFVYWVNPGGYVGESAAWEFGNAHSLRREDGTRVPVYAWEKPQNATFALYLQGQIFDPESLCQKLIEQMGKTVADSGKHLFFDLDDTLVNDQGQLQAAERAIEDLLPGFQRAFIELERINIPADRFGYGFGMMSYFSSLVEAYYKTDLMFRFETEFKKILAGLIAKRKAAPELLPDAREVLEELQRRNYRLHILSHGDQRTQMDRLIAADLHKYFLTIHVVKRKDTEAYGKIQAELSLAATQCCMIGNSIRYDINPALAAGWGAIYFHSHPHWTESWEHDQAPLIEENLSRLIEIDSLGSLLALLE